MKKVVLFFALAFVWNGLFAQNKTWVGPNAGLWSTAGNWAPLGMPGTADTVIFNSANACDLDVNPVIAALRATGTGGNIISSVANKSMTIGNAGSVPSVLKIDAGASLTLGNGGFGISVSTYGTGGANTAQVAGTFTLAFASSWTVNNTGQTNITNTDITGTVSIPSVQTGSVIINGSIATVRFLSGSNLIWARNGGTIPDADYQNGSTINVTGVTSTMPSLSGAANYNGLLIWNNSAQTISGSSAVLLPTASYAMDSIRVVNTGSGTLRMFTEPTGYTLGHLEVQGGTVEMSAPLVSNKTGSIATDLKISGGTVLGNATFIGESAVGTAMTLSVGGKLIMTGGTFDLTNRPIGVGLNGAFQLNVAGDIAVSAGTVTATSAFGSQNQIALNSSVTQNVTLATYSGAITLFINNSSTGGIVLLNPLTIPASGVVNFFNGIITTTTVNLLTFSSGSLAIGASNGSFVDGPVKKIGNTDFVFPVGKPNCGPSANIKGYIALAISNFTGATATDAFTAEYKRGAGGTTISAAGLDHVSVCDYWTLTRDNGTPLVDITLSWDENRNNCITPKPYVNQLSSLVVAHSNNNLSPWDSHGTTGGVAGVTTQGTIAWSGTQSGTFGSFAIGSINFNNPLPINLNYLNGFKQGSSNYLNWKVTCTNNPTATMILERSTDGRNFIGITSITADALRCQQPFDYIDGIPATGMNYYRLKMLDANGKISYSTVIGILNATKGFDIVSLAPTIITTSATLNVAAAQKTKMDLVIRDAAGRQVAKIAYNLKAGSNQLQLNVGKLTTGVYMITGYTDGGASGTVKFVKQ